MTRFLAFACGERIFFAPRVHEGLARVDGAACRNLGARSLRTL